MWPPAFTGLTNDEKGHPELRNVWRIQNANEFVHISAVNATLGLSVPAWVTPLELTAGKEQDDE